MLTITSLFLVTKPCLAFTLSFYTNSRCGSRSSGGLRGVLHGNPLLGRRLQPAKYRRVSAAISSLPGKPPVSLEIRRVLTAKAQTDCVPRQWLPFRPHTPTHTDPTDAASRNCSNWISGIDISASKPPINTIKQNTLATTQHCRAIHELAGAGKVVVGWRRLNPEL